MSDPKKSEPDEELLEFLGGIDEANDETQSEDFFEFLARADIEKIAAGKPKTPVKEEKSE